MLSQAGVAAGCMFDTLGGRGIVIKAPKACYRSVALWTLGPAPTSVDYIHC
jgi:hypothetical protein